MNKKTKMFSLMIIIIFNCFAAYVIAHKDMLSKADQQLAKSDANIYEGQIANKFDTSLEQKQAQTTSLFGSGLTRGSSNVQNSTVTTPGSFRMTGQSYWNDIDNRIEVKLTWTPPLNAGGGYIVERDTQNNFSTGQEIGTSYGKHFNVLNVAPKNAANGKWFEKWMKMPNVSNTGPVDKGLFNITTVSMQQFNANPGMLKNPDGSYKFDSIFFGAADWNSDYYNPNNQDLTFESYQATKSFGDTGRAITFGHDTIEGSVWRQDGAPKDRPYHTYFNYFAPLLGLQVSPKYKLIGGDRIQIATPGSLTESPYYLDPTVTYHISQSHSFRSYYMYDSGAIRWIKYDLENLNWENNEGYAELKDDSGRAIGDNNWYLVSKNNYAQIQTGHTSGECSPQEAQVIFNMIYYTSSLNTGTNGIDIIAKDVAAPDTPALELNSVSTTGASFNVDSQDNATDYYYRSRTDSSAGRKYSDIIRIPVMSGVRGYVYTVDDNPDGIPAVITDSSTGRVSNINLTPNDAQNFTLERVSSIGKYLHIVAVDNANNVSGVKTINLTDYLWWKIDPATKVLTIYPHELNGSIDTTPVGEYWPWIGQATTISKVVISPGVTARGSLKNLFLNLTSATTVEGLSSLDTSHVTDMASMFDNCKSLISLDVSNFNTANVNSMASMFSRCESLTSLDVTSFNTSNVTSFLNMFSDMSKLTSLDLSGFNSAKIQTMNKMLSSTTKLWKLTLGSKLKFTTDIDLENPTKGTAIEGTPIYYVTSNNWRGVGTGTDHEPKGDLKTVAQIIAESKTRTDKRTYVWDQVGRQTLKVGNSIDFGTHRGSKGVHEYVSDEQHMKIEDNRNGRTGKSWRIEAKGSKPLTLVSDSTKKISGNPLYHHDLTSGVITNLTSVSQTIHNETAGSNYLDQFSYPWKLKFKSSPSSIPKSGQYKGEVTYTLINSTP